MVRESSRQKISESESHCILWAFIEEFLVNELGVSRGWPEAPPAAQFCGLSGLEPQGELESSRREGGGFIFWQKGCETRPPLVGLVRIKPPVEDTGKEVDGT